MERAEHLDVLVGVRRRIRPGIREPGGAPDPSRVLERDAGALGHFCGGEALTGARGRELVVRVVDARRRELLRRRVLPLGHAGRPGRCCPRSSVPSPLPSRPRLHRLSIRPPMHGGAGARIDPVRDAARRRRSAGLGRGPRRPGPALLPRRRLARRGRSRVARAGARRPHLVGDRLPAAAHHGQLRARQRAQGGRRARARGRARAHGRASRTCPRVASTASAVLGELGLDGSVRPVPGTLVLADALRRTGIESLIVPPANAHEAALLDGGGGPLRPVARRAAGVPEGRAAVARPAGSARRGRSRGRTRSRSTSPTSAGLATARVALEVAAAGSHHLIYAGPPGTGKTMLARRLATILPPLDADESFEVTRIASAVGRRPAAPARDPAPVPRTAPHRLDGRARRRRLGPTVAGRGHASASRSAVPRRAR